MHAHAAFVPGHLIPLLLATSLALAAGNAPAQTKPAKAKTGIGVVDKAALGKPVQVTPEMIGAGIVSSGAVLPPSRP